MVSFMVWSLYPWKRSPQYPLDRTMGGPQGYYGHSGDEKIPEVPLLGFKSQSSSL